MFLCAQGKEGGQDMAQWDKEFDDIDFYGGEAFFIMDDSQNMIEIRYHGGMFIDVGLDSDNIYNITVLGSNDSEGLNSPLCVVKISEREKLHDKLQEIIWRFREGVKDDDETENRTAELLDKYGLDFMNVPAGEIRELLSVELKAPADAEYIRLLCAYLFCAGGKEDAELIRKAKYKTNMDIGAMIDKEWLTSLENGEAADDETRSRDELIADIVMYYMDYEDKLQWD